MPDANGGIALASMVRLGIAIAAAVLASLHRHGPAAAASGADTFRLPSGNIYCAYEHYSFAPIDLRCEIRSGVKPLPPRPKACGDADWGGGYSMRTHRACARALHQRHDLRPEGEGARVRNNLARRRVHLYLPGSRLALHERGRRRLLPQPRALLLLPPGGAAKRHVPDAVREHRLRLWRPRFVECGIKSGLKPRRRRSTAVPATSPTNGQPDGDRPRDPGDLRRRPRTVRVRVEGLGARLRGDAGRAAASAASPRRRASPAGTANGHGFFLSRERWRSF